MNSMESQLSTSKEKIIITWFNDPTMGDRNYIQSIKERLEDIASILSSFDDDDECIAQQHHLSQSLCGLHRTITWCDRPSITYSRRACWSCS